MHRKTAPAMAINPKIKTAKLQTNDQRRQIMGDFDDECDQYRINKNERLSNALVWSFMPMPSHLWLRRVANYAVAPIADATTQCAKRTKCQCQSSG